MGSEAETIRNLQARIHYLEENRRYIQNSLEMVLSLSDFHKHLTQECDHQKVLKEALQRFKKIIPMLGGAIYLVDDQTAEFSLTLCEPEPMRELISQQVENMIEEGFFAWAIRERRSVFISPDDQTRQFLVHVIANHSRVIGMFVGLLQAGKISLPDTSLSLVSITLLNLANVIESLRLYQWVKDQNSILEKKVEERTLKLNHSREKLKQTMVSLKKMADEADQANKAKSQFLANMSHEIRTPLNGIIGCAELILKSDDLANCRSLARVSLNESEHLLHLINNVLDYSKIEAEKIELESKPFDLLKLLRTLIAGLQIQAEAKGLTLNLELIGTTHFSVVGDALRLRQVLINLVNNAIKFTAKGSVTVVLEPRDTIVKGTQTLSFSVIDTGIGIPASRQTAIFQRFTQVDESTTRRYGGTGLGTTIAYQLVSLMGGDLRVDSTPGQGTTFSFTITLPLSGAPRGRDKLDDDNANELNSMRRAHILLVEDTPVNQFVVRSHLESQGHTVILAENGLLAVEACRTQRFNLVLMDLQMPEMDGLQATRRIRSQNTDESMMPIIALTADTDSQTRAACEAAGMQAVLHKPVRREALLAVINAHLCGDNGDCAEPPLSPSADNEAERPADAVQPLDLDTAIYEFGERDLVRQVVEQLVENGQVQLEEIRNALGRRDMALIRQRAHALKGGAATAEAGPLSDAAAELESVCKTGVWESVPPSWARLEMAFDELTSHIKTIAW